MARRVFVLVLVLVAVGCRPPGRVVSLPPAEPPGLRLGDAVVPLHQMVELVVAPSRETFSGRVEIDVERRRPVTTIWLHALDLEIESATVDGEAATVDLRSEDGLVGLGVAEPAAGPATLELTFSGRLARVDTSGLFTEEQEGEWYLFSQFQAIDARRAFPCFDEPGFKLPWQLTLRVPLEDRAFSNTPVESTWVEGAERVVRFEETAPLPVYLVALAVGPFDVAEEGVAGRASTPVRTITVRGEGGKTAFAGRASLEILEILEEYFGTPHPFEKLDQVAVPYTVGFGAMEHPGLVTYAEDYLVHDGEPTRREKIGSGATIAHELAHMWFGNLVTLAWWDDTWLNEGFATWMEGKTIARWRPEWYDALDRVEEREGVRTRDGLPSSRSVRQPVVDEGGIARSFDGISYQKGEALLAMVEAWLGEEVFRDRVRAYLDRFAHGTASADDFLASLGGEAAEVLSSFLEQPGIPLVTLELRCDEEVPTLLASQERFLPLDAKPADSSPWMIPLCVRPEGGERSCTLLSSAEAEIELPGTSCPGWVVGNDGGSGYYRVAYRGPLLGRLLAADLDPAELLATLGDVEALVRNGRLPAGEALALVPRFAERPERQITGLVADLTVSLGGELVSEGVRPAFERFVRDVFSERARELGWEGEPGDDLEAEILRPQLLGLVAGPGADLTLRSEARAVAESWLEGAADGVADEVVATALRIAAEGGDEALFDRYLEAARATKDRRERRRLLGALSSFPGADLRARTFALGLASEFDIREMRDLFSDLAQNPEGAEELLGLLAANWDEVIAALPREWLVFLPFVTSSLCDVEKAAAAEAFFRPRLADVPGASVTLDRALVRAGACATLRARQQGAVDSFFLGWEAAARAGDGHGADPT